MTDSDDDSITSATPAQQCLFWSLSVAFMLKLACFVIVAVIIHNNAWVVVEPKNFDYAFIRGISFDDCAYSVAKPDHIECIKWSLENQTEWFEFWTKHKVNHVNVSPPAAWYANAYYICLLLLVWYILDMSAMLVMCCRQRRLPDNATYQKQISLLCTIFIILTYVSVHIGLAHSRQTDFVRVQFESKSSYGLGAKLFIATFGVYLLACLIQHAYQLYTYRDSLRNPQLIFKQINFQSLFGRFQSPQRRDQPNAANRSPQQGRRPQEVEMQRLRDI